MTKRILCFLVCVCVVLCCTACGEKSTSTQREPSGSSSMATPSNNIPHPTTEAQWVAVPYTSQKQLDAGLTGGEGGQWPTYISFDAIDGSLAFLGIDVGGMFRSRDGGITWEPCTIGITASAASCAEVDPTNLKRVLCVGVDSGATDSHGLYLSTDSGETWRHVNPQSNQGHRDFRHQIAYDKSSYDKKLGYCTTVYYVREHKKTRDDHILPPALFKSTDGGETWKEINSDKAIGNGIIYVHPEKGWVYIATEKGAIRSKDGGKTFSKMLDAPCYGMCVVNSRPDNIYISAKNGFYLSTDSGDSFVAVNKSGYPTRYPARVNVSPANPNYMILQDDHLSDNGTYESKNYYSHDGGKTWKESITDSSMSFIPYNTRQTVFAWHPTDEKVCISTGGDMALRSTDGGKTFTWSGSGYNGSTTMGIHMNVNNNDLIFCSNHDYNGAFSVDGGKTWTYVASSDTRWGGWTRGGYPISKDTCAVLATDVKKQVYRIVILTEGGTKGIETGKVINGYNVGCGLIGNENVVFLGEWRSEDKGATWTQMTGCSGVYTCTNDGVLYGRDGQFQLVKSTDGGKTWIKLRMIEDLTDIKYDEFNKRVLVLAKSNIFTYNESTKKMDMVMDVHLRGISYQCNGFDIDPRNGTVYAAVRSEGLECKPIGVVRTTDGGQSWVNLCREPNDGSVGPDGGKKPLSIVFNRKHNEVWTNSVSRGVWKIAAKK